MSHLRPVGAPAPESGGEPEPEETLLDRTVLPYLRDPALWPVCFAILGHVAILVALPMLGILRGGGGPLEWFAMFLVLSGTWGGIRAERRNSGSVGALTGAIAFTWALAALMAWAADRYDVL